MAFETETLTRTKVKKPSLYKVVLYNDDFTPMDFVVEILMGIFGKSEDEATAIMLMVHNSGKGVCGIYTYEVAETKVMEVLSLSRKQQYPLKCQMEQS